jgi:hypothetical protein
MSILRAIALIVIVAFGGAMIAAGFMTSPASANKMDGKAGGYGSRGSANYGPPKSGTAKPPTSIKKQAQ